MLNKKTKLIIYPIAIISLYTCIAFFNHAQAATPFVSVVDPGSGAGMDYTSLSAWNTGVLTDLTAAATQVFSGTPTSTIVDNAPVYLCRGGVYQSHAGTVVHETSTQILIEGISGSATEAANDRWYTNSTCTSVNYFVISDGGDSAIAVAKCRSTNGTADSNYAVINGWTTSSTNYIKVWTDTAENYRHPGRWDDTKYRLAMSFSSGAPLSIAEEYVRIDGLQINNEGTAGVGGPNGIYIGGTSNTNSDIRISNNIIKSTPSNSYYVMGIYCSSNYNTYIWNNVISGWGYAIQVFNTDTASSLIIYNNTIINPYQRGINAYVTAGGAFRLYNNIIQGWPTENSYLASGTTATGNNISEDASSPNSTFRNKVVIFKDEANGDFHLDSRDTSAKNSGANLYADPTLAIITDIDNGARPNSTSFDIGADECMTEVYYSVGQNTSNHCGPSGDGTSCGNVSIVSGVATFTAAQAATNLGVGDALVAAGNTYYISKKNSTTSWNVITAQGAVPANLAAGVTSISHAFSSLSAAEAGASGASYLNTSNLVAGNYQLNIACYYDSAADTTATTVDGWTTAPTNYIRIYTPNNTSTEVNQSQRHSGKWDTGKYRLEVAGLAGGGAALTISDNYVKVDGLQIYISSMVNNLGMHGISFTAAGAGPRYYISNNIIKGYAANTYSYHTGLAVFSNTATSDGIVYAWNNIFYDWKVTPSDTTARGIGITDADSKLYAYNNTVQNCTVGLFRSAGTFVAINNLVKGSDAGYSYDGTFTAPTNYNSTDLNDAIGVGANNRVSQTISLANESNDDFHLTGSDAGARNFGTPLSGTFPYFSDDVDAELRNVGGAWDIGADEVAGSSATLRMNGGVKINGGVRVKVN